MVDPNQVWCLLVHGTLCLILECQEPERQSGVQFGVVSARVLELTILIVLHQMVIGIARKREWAWRSVSILGNLKGNLKRRSPGLAAARCLESNPMTLGPTNEVGAIGQFVQALECAHEISATEMEGLASVRSDARRSTMRLELISMRKRTTRPARRGPAHTR